MSAENSAAAKNLEQKETAPTVLLIAHRQNQFNSGASFLTRRGIHCTLRGNIKDAIQFITKNKPTYVFLSWNLPNANIVKTYQLFVQKFNVVCIVFAEKSDGKTAAELANSRIPETMQAPVSGPGLYMRIQKLIKNKNEDPAEIRQTRDGYKKDDDKQNFIRMSSGIKQDDKPGIINFQNTKYSESDIEDSSQHSSSNFNSDSLKNPSSNPDDNDISEYLNDLELDNNTNDKANFNSTNANNHKNFATDENKTTISSQINLSQKEDSDFSEEKRYQGNEGVSTKKKSKEIDYGSVVNIAKKEQDDDFGIVNATTMAKSQSTIFTGFSPKAESKGAQSILFQETLQAFKNCTRPVTENYSSVSVISKAKLLNICSQRFCGYLITVVPMYHELDKGLFSEIKANLETLLKKQGETLMHFEELSIDLEQIEFLPWCKEFAEFFIQTADRDNEIICAYFPVQPSLPKFDENNSMAVISASDLQANTKSKMNLFIHLPKNNKFLRYLKSGDTITEKHKEKFEKNNLKNLHIKKDELTQFKEYFASQQINECIRKK